VRGLTSVPERRFPGPPVGERRGIVESGQLISGRYRLREELGRGGMSVVWRADDDVLGRDVAVKVLSASFARDPEVQRRIRSEARAAARLRHPNVVSVFDYGEFTDGGQVLSYVVMELVDGRSVADMISGGPLPWNLAVLIGAQVAAALAAAHADGIVHRDVKPANVMVTSSGVKLVDFGVSAAVGALDDRGGQLLGTPAYLAPERLQGGPVRPSTDVYALGLLLYRALCGRMPWPASTITQMVRAHVVQRPAPLPPIAGLPAEVVRLVSRCLAKQPADRPSAVEAAEVLGEIAGLPSPTLLRSSTTATVTLTVPVARRRTRTLVAASVAAALLATAAGAWWARDLRSGPSPSVAAVAEGAVRPAPSAATSAPATASPAATTTVRTVRVVRPPTAAQHPAAAAPAPGKAKAPPGPAPKAKPAPPKKPKKAKKPKPGHG
jgi:eukaryotic-like serine/threonine-protein kinase